MRTAFIVASSACALALELAACATNAPPKPARTANALPAPTGDKADFKIPYGYRLIKQNGQDYYCRRETITGSHTNKRDVCLTLAQLQRERDGIEDLVRRAQDTRTTGPGADGSGGRYNSVLTPQ